jgi:membrane associated rhomboid family serine protease
LPIPLKDNVPTSRLPLVTILLIVANIAVFAWQLTFSDSKDFSLDYPGITERDVNTIEYGAIPYRLTHFGGQCYLGAEAVTASSAQPAVVCKGTEEFSQAVRLHERHLASIPAPLPLDEAPWWLTVFTSMFMHGGWLHIAFNMLFLWIFGGNVEDAMGRLRFLGFYLLAGVAAIYSQCLLDPSSTQPTLGASGAIAGVLGAYALLLPRARILTLIFVLFFVTLVEIPAYVLLGIWFVLQFIPAVSQVAVPDLGGGGVAYFAHVGGFVFGLALVRFFAQRRPVPAADRALLG